MILPPPRPGLEPVEVPAPAAVPDPEAAVRAAIEFRDGPWAREIAHTQSGRGA